MPSMTLPLRAEMEDGTTYDVKADQRDLSRWEVQPFGCSFAQFESKAMTGMRWLAWHALTRTGVITMKWEHFDKVCVEVGEIPSEVSEDDSSDPGKPGRSGARS